MSFPLIPVATGLQLLKAAASLPAVVRSADFAGLLNGVLKNSSGTSTQRATPPGKTARLAHAQELALGIPSVGDSYHDVTGIRSQTETLIQSFQTRLNQVLEENDLDTFPGLHLQLDSNGQLHLAGPHFDQQAIESVLQSHPELTDIFRAIVSNLKLLQNAGQGPGEQSALGSRPESTVLLKSKPASTIDLFVETDYVRVTNVEPKAINGP